MKSIAICFLLWISIHPAYSQNWQWARQVSSSHSLNKTCSGVDEFGNVSVCGTFTDTLNIGSVQLTSPIPAIYLAKYDVSGSLVYARIIARDSAISVNDLQIDAVGKSIITGSYKGTASFGPNNYIINSSGDYDVFVAACDDVNFLWVQSLGMAGYDYGAAVSTDASENIYLTGEYHISPYPFSGSKIFIAKFDSNGNNEWLHVALNYSSTDLSEDITTDSIGNSVITGQLFGTMTFDSVAILDAGNVEANVFVIAFDSSGDLRWMQKAGAASGYCSGMSVSLNQNGDCYLSGFFHGTISLGNFSLSGSFGIANQAFFAKLDSSGAFQNVAKADGPSQGRKISATGNGFLACGIFTDSLHAGNDFLNNVASQAIFLIEGDAQCNLISGKQIGGVHNATLSNCTWTSAGIVVSGTFQDSLMLGNGNDLISSTNNYDAFVVNSIGVSSTNEQFARNSITAMPNPTNGLLNILFNSPGKYSIVVFNSAGQVVKKRELEIFQEYQGVKFNLEDLVEGYYMIHVESSTSLSNLKVVKL